MPPYGVSDVHVPPASSEKKAPRAYANSPTGTWLTVPSTGSAQPTAAKDVVRMTTARVLVVSVLTAHSGGRPTEKYAGVTVTGPTARNAVEICSGGGRGRGLRRASGGRRPPALHTYVGRRWDARGRVSGEQGGREGNVPRRSLAVNEDEWHSEDLERIVAGSAHGVHFGENERHGVPRKESQLACSHSQQAVIKVRRVIDDSLERKAARRLRLRPRWRAGWRRHWRRRARARRSLRRRARLTRREGRR